MVALIAGSAEARAMDLQALLVGLQGLAPQVPGVSAVRLQADKLPSLTLRDCRIIVLGDQSLNEFDPAAFRRMLRGRHSLVILCADRVDPGRLARWVEHGFERVCRPSGLQDLLSEAAALLRAGLVRPILELEDWCGVVPPEGSEAQRAVRLVPDLECAHSVTEWARRLGCCRKKLWKVTTTWLGAAPREVLFWYVQTVARWGCDQGWGRERIAGLLGYHDKRSLEHAFSRRGLALPPPPPATRSVSGNERTPLPATNEPCRAA